MALLVESVLQLPLTGGSAKSPMASLGGEPLHMPGRLMVRHWSAVQRGGIVLASVYLVTGEAPANATNLAILQQAAHELLLTGRPYIMGGLSNDP